MSEDGDCQKAKNQIKGFQVHNEALMRRVRTLQSMHRRQISVIEKQTNTIIRLYEAMDRLLADKLNAQDSSQ